jgi:hypothetical protein
MISVRVKTPMLEVAVASDIASDSLSDIVKAVIDVGQSAPVQNSLQAPIIVKSLSADMREPTTVQKQLALFPMHDGAERSEQQTKDPEARRAGDEQPVQHKKLAKGKGERTIAYNKTQELISRGFFSEGGKSLSDIQRALSAIGYNISDGKLADSLLRLVREEQLIREGERGSYIYRISAPSRE